MSDEDLWRTLREVSNMPYGAGQIAALEQLIRRADASEDRELAFAVRMEATTGYGYGGEPAKSFVTFSWCLAEFDRDPQPYHERYTHYLLWFFKHMVNAMLTFPEVPLDRTYAVLDDMEQRYRAGGHSLQAVYKHRYLVADHVGERDNAAEWYRRWLTTPRDELSDCAGCDPTTQVRSLAEAGRDEEAVALAEPVLAGRLTCNEQPQAILTALLLPYLRTGRLDAARDAHREAYRRVRGNLADLWDIGDHVEFCTLTGNGARAVEIVERHLDWLDRAPSPASAMHFAATSSAALRQAGADITVYRRASGDRPAGEIPAAVLASELADTATALAARFDERNGTTHQSEWIARRLAVTPTGTHLPLSASLRRSGRRPAQAGPDHAPPTGTGQAAQAGPDHAKRREPVEIPADATADDLLDLADECWRTHREEAFAAALAAYDEKFADVEVPPRTAARRLELRCAQRADGEDRSAALAAGRAALAAFQDLPDPVHAQVVAGRLGVLLCMASDGAEEGLALARESAAYLDQHGDVRQRAAGHDRLAIALMHIGHWPEALIEVDRAATEAEVDPYLAARVALHRTAILEQLADRPAEFRESATDARRRGRELGLDDVLTAACLACSRATDDPEEAVDACDEAAGVALPSAQLPVRVARGRALLAAGRPEEAVDDLVEAVTLCVEQGQEGDAFLRWELANAYRLAGRLGEAAEVAEEAIIGLDRLGAQAEADRCRHLLAGIYEGLGATEPALALLDQLADNLDGPDNLPHRAQVLEEAGGILYDADRDALAVQRFAAAATAYRLADLPVEEMRARRRETSARYWSGDLPGAVAGVEAMDTSAAALAGQPDEPPMLTYELAMVADTGARILAGDGREGDALDRLAGVPDRLRSIEAFGEAANAELLVGELLLRRGQPVEAERLLRTVLGGLPTGSPPAARAAALLAHALDLLERSAEARALRQEHGLSDE
ncbi:hypothetical protein [Plantactinospora sp. GCM10030261]|uniref:hypothetical protein n=1 Tax=Plantactinospora sp. GCM10030261 TaxID=3273420 RepID=UPI00360FF441